MAGDWIKMRHNLETDPDVLRIAEHVGVDRFSVVGRLHMIWSWADQHSLDGCAVGATTSFLDELVCCAGFCKALRSVGWLDGRDWELFFPNFDRHNGETAKKRAQAKKSMAKKRAGSATNVAQNAQPEKRREEKSNSYTHTRGSPLLKSTEFREVWQRWKRHRSEKHKPLGEIEAETQLMELGRLDVGAAQAIVEFSIRQGALNLITNGDHRADRPVRTSKHEARGLAF